jgi:hypothetical protein
MITVTDTHSWAVLQDGRQSMRFENRIAWQLVRGQRRIIAVGGPEQWAAPGPLPPDATMIELIDLAIHDRELARVFWEQFLSYVFFSAKPPWWRRDPLLQGLGLFREEVQLKLSRMHEANAVREAIEQSRSPRFRVQSAAIR